MCVCVWSTGGSVRVQIRAVAPRVGAIKMHKGARRRRLSYIREIFKTLKRFCLLRLTDCGLQVDNPLSPNGGNSSKKSVTSGRSFPT